MKPPHKILVAATRRIGDVLLATPLIRTLRCAWPEAEIDVLVFSGTEGVLAGNPDISRILTISQRPAHREHLRLIAGLWRKYDLALSAMPGDRPTLYAIFAGRRSLGPVAEGSGQGWKKLLLSASVPFDNLETHTVLMNLKLAERLEIVPCFEVAVSWRRDEEASLLDVLPFDPASTPYAVIHVYPMYAYKMWRREAWAELARWIDGQGLRLVLTGGKDPAEADHIRELLPLLPGNAVDVSGKLSLGGVACLLASAAAYVGPDTAITHMAAALGIPTVALFGPSNPVKWGPWPKGCKENPWRMKGSQKRNNVVLLQGKGDCVPCMEEGCERHTASPSACLQNLPATDAIDALKELLKA